MLKEKRKSPVPDGEGNRGHENTICLRYQSQGAKAEIVTMVYSIP